MANQAGRKAELRALLREFRSYKDLALREIAEARANSETKRLEEWLEVAEEADRAIAGLAAELEALETGLSETPPALNESEGPRAAASQPRPGHDHGPRAEGQPANRARGILAAVEPTIQDRAVALLTRTRTRLPGGFRATYGEQILREEGLYSKSRLKKFRELAGLRAEKRNDVWWWVPFQAPDCICPPCPALIHLHRARVSDHRERR